MAAGGLLVGGGGGWWAASGLVVVGAGGLEADVAEPEVAEADVLDPGCIVIPNTYQIARNSRFNFLEPKYGTTTNQPCTSMQTLAHPGTHMHTQEHGCTHMHTYILHTHAHLTCCSYLLRV